MPYGQLFRSYLIMKRHFLLLALLATTFATYAGQPPLPQGTCTPPHLEFKWHGFYCSLDYTFMTNLNKEHGGYMDQNGVEHQYIDKYSLNGVTCVAGWMWRKESAVGLGFSYLNDPTGSFSQIPVFVEFRSHFLRSRVTPFTTVQLGYSIPFGSKNKEVEYTRIDEGGLTVGVSAGARFALRQRLGINAYVGYQMIQTRSLERGWNQVAATKLPELYHNFKFGVGINF